jgi:ubiquinol oxidase
MERDHGWINHLLEEAENERIHLLIWMKVVQPTFFERLMVMTAQLGFLFSYSILYALSPKGAHRLVGYLEEDAFLQYSEMIKAIDNGKIQNIEAPEVARNYYNLAPNSTLRDVVLCIRADELHHSLQNHVYADKYLNKIN